MNKNIKKIIAIALAIGTVSAFSPITKINLLTTKAYASTDDDENEDTTLEGLELKTSSGNSIKLYDDSSYDNKIDKDEVSDGDTYYAKTSSSTVDVDVDGPSSKYVRVFKGTSDSTKGKKISNDISLSSGTTTTLVVRVYNSEPDSDVKYEEDSDVASEYKIKVKCTSSDSSDSSDSNDSYDDIYLDRLSIDGESISLSKSKTTYSYNVASDVDEVTIKAVPEDTDYTVTIDGDEVNEDDDSFKNDVSLDKGENKIEVEIQNEDDDTDRVYTLNITRGSTSTDTSTETNTSTNTASTIPSTATNVSTNVKLNQWVQVNGGWQYNDSTGNPVKNNWFADRNYGKRYFLKADGYMATGWLNYSGKWYYLGNDGGMQTGWVIDGGKYYYLYADGSMAYSTTISGYKLGADGAWIR